MSVDHYENFPVASLLLPRRLRGAVHDIYRFARSADDIADEGDADAATRLAQLAAYRQALEHIDAGEPAASVEARLRPVFVPLAETISRHGLPLGPFFDLLSAFEQDITTTRYETDIQLFDYCKRSANPVGRLMLHLYGVTDASSLTESEAICTGLQLVKFWQDVAIDWHKGRVYLPRRVLERHGVTEAYIADRAATAPAAQAQASARLKTDADAGGRADLAWQTLMREQVQQARGLLHAGLPLTSRLPGRLGLELKLIVHGGLRILERLDQ